MYVLGVVCQVDWLNTDADVRDWWRRMLTDPTSPITAQALAATPIGGVGFESVDTRLLEQVSLSRQNVARLSGLGIEVIGPLGERNCLYLDPRESRLRLRILLNGKIGNTLVLERGHNLRAQSQISFEGNEHIAIFRAGQGVSSLTITMRGDAGVFFFGENCTSNSTNALVWGPAHICIGEDCMFATETIIRTFDSHAIFDTDKSMQLNAPESVVIHPHVWLGARAIVMPGVHIGAGAIVASSALVTKCLPGKTLWAGIPAKKLREGVSWTRSASPTGPEMDRVVNLIRERQVD